MACTPAGPEPNARQMAAAQAAQRAQNDVSDRYVTANIQDIQIADWVLADNPELPDSTPDGADDIDPASWRVIRAEMEKPDGGRLKVALLRPVGWIEETGAIVGGTVELDMAEVGAEGPVTAVEPCPEIAERPHPGCRLVTGTFAHTATDVVDLQIEGQPLPVGVTATHPFWSAERRAFVPAGDLKVGELVGTAADTLLPVQSLHPRPHPEPVFNLEVDTEHVYYVTRDGVLVHNKCGKGSRGPRPTKYHKRTVREVKKLRDRFNRGIRKRYLKWLSKQKGAREKYGDAWKDMDKGRVPDGYVVHHKLPLFRGGTNRYDNLKLMLESEHTSQYRRYHWYPEGENPFD